MCDDLNVNRLNKSDTEWLDDYVFIMEPLAVCLDILQGDKNMYFEFLIPSISHIIDNCLKNRFSIILNDPF